MDYRFGFFSKVIFYVSYVYYRVATLWEVREGKVAVLFADFIWFINRIFSVNFPFPNIIKREFVSTRLGKFYIPPDIISTVTVSPAFERLDVDYLLQLIKKDVKRGKKILFIDIGANFGLYSVAVAAKFKKVDVIACEPDTDYITIPTYNLLLKNIKENNLKNVKPFKKGIGTKKGLNKAEIKVYPLAQIIGKKYFKDYDVVYIKMDIDEYVIDGLEGIKDSLMGGVQVIMLIEDFIFLEGIKKFMKKNNFFFLKKLTSYNSFWTYKV